MHKNLHHLRPDEKINFLDKMIKLGKLKPGSQETQAVDKMMIKDGVNSYRITPGSEANPAQILDMQKKLADAGHHGQSFQMFKKWYDVQCRPRDITEFKFNGKKVDDLYLKTLTKKQVEEIFTNFNTKANQITNEINNALADTESKTSLANCINNMTAQELRETNALGFMYKVQDYTETSKAGSIPEKTITNVNTLVENVRNKLGYKD
jgi:hypothetical protein